MSVFLSFSVFTAASGSCIAGVITRMERVAFIISASGSMVPSVSGAARTVHFKLRNSIVAHANHSVRGNSDFIPESLSPGVSSEISDLTLTFLSLK